MTSQFRENPVTDSDDDDGFVYFILIIPGLYALSLASQAMARPVFETINYS